MDRARELERFLRDKYSGDLFLTGSLVTGLNVPGSVDFDFVLPAENPQRFHELKDALERDFKPMSINRETSDFAVFQGAALNEKIDIALLPVHKAQMIRERQVIVQKSLSEEEKRRIISRKKRLRNLPILSRRIYNWYKRRLWKRLGMPRFYRVDMVWPDDGVSWPD
ncbi:MAG: nucleotidyltransferase domain-containing protein [Candidatus Krumholzibacteriota bacterium]|nr:nucleotidyltransferase domain-containing protein [Candidatus Krumholzibacteriota bacterium]